ncbi:TM2 domain-containing protein almondex-like [Actinia tenebrosa]|uniref:TM2 domain-containing protein almondex-like n=1 Tax=Actinia tenebrosa TaxID=6105 RepID=A0A6P8IB10_ACTTE|nr:TM2 domain-containing protein almondex-like [Actinia tenebrosa]
MAADGERTPTNLLIFLLQTVVFFTFITTYGEIYVLGNSVPCSKLSASCLECKMSNSCVYGQDTQVECIVLDHCQCQGDRSFTKTYNCRYCYLTPKESYKCTQKTHCKVISGNSPPPHYLTNCTVNEDVLCLGNRTFSKYLPCTWTSGYRWSTTFLLSLTLGGFGVDRFYLGHWKEGLGKLFSFGGLGVWTLVDLVLVAIGYVGPADGSLYIF